MRGPAAGLVALGLLLTVVVSDADGALANDDASEATEITGLPFSAELDGSLATLEPAEPQPGGCASFETSVWYRYTAPVDQELHATTFLSTGDPMLAVYRDEPGGPLALCSDDFAIGVVAGDGTFRLAAGTTAFIQVGLQTGAGIVRFALTHRADLPSPCDGDGCPRFSYDNVIGPIGNHAGETNIAVNPRTNVAMLLLLGRAVRVEYDDADQPSFSDVTEPLLSTTNDPILWADPDTGRIFVAQLRARIGSVIGFTDDDGDTWQLSEPGVVLPSWDHQSVGGGPYPELLRGRNPVYPNAIYYCAQAGLALNQCARSDNGGLTWGGPFPMNVAACGGLHGHIAVSPVTGTVVVPHKDCGQTQGVLTSTTAAQTWTARMVPATTPARSDPAVAFDRAGRLYFVTSSDGRAVVTVSEDEGVTWSESIDLGAPYGIANAEFPMAVAGDDGRAAVAWYGTSTPGNDQGGFFNGVWRVYVSITTDAGRTWSTVEATPDDPIQRGCIWLQGGSNPCRNLLDFQDITIDADGRVLVSVADGCYHLGEFPCSGPSGSIDDSRASRAAIIRQVGGPRLLLPDSPA